jgi:type II secretory pathway pseudopilin PulG
MKPNFNTRGFTLVEIVVTSVIMMILAGVSVPLYTGYVEGQRLAAVKSLAATAAVSANAMSRRGVVPTAPIVKSSLFLPDPTAFTFVVDNVAGTVSVTDVSHPSATTTALYK